MCSIAMCIKVQIQWRVIRYLICLPSVKASPEDYYDIWIICVYLSVNVYNCCLIFSVLIINVLMVIRIVAIYISYQMFINIKVLHIINTVGILRTNFEFQNFSASLICHSSLEYLSTATLVTSGVWQSTDVYIECVIITKKFKHF